jgi:hypothetical protein
MHSTRHAFGLRPVEPPKRVEMTAIDLKGHGRPYQLALSSDDNWLFIVKTRTFKETPIGDGSVLNALRALIDGTVPEIGSSPLTLPVRDDLLATAVGPATH